MLRFASSILRFASSILRLARSILQSRIACWLLIALPTQVCGEAAALLRAGHVEPLAWVAVLTARTPVRAATLAPRAASRLRGGALLVRRLPQSSAREPQHHRVRMPHLKLPESRQ
jgi:hypothetical protein